MKLITNPSKQLFSRVARLPAFRPSRPWLVEALISVPAQLAASLFAEVGPSHRISPSVSHPVVCGGSLFNLLRAASDESGFEHATGCVFQCISPDSGQKSFGRCEACGYCSLDFRDF